ncbi:MAG: PEP-CTERM sorting domain-containing protein [Phenylobacterium sp.]|nr:PEP-CTERM sorting domain-containing protein [Phenylobacterium sp.]
MAAAAAATMLAGQAQAAVTYISSSVETYGQVFLQTPITGGGPEAWDEDTRSDVADPAMVDISATTSVAAALTVDDVLLSEGSSTATTSIDFADAAHGQFRTEVAYSLANYEPETLSAAIYYYDAVYVFHVDAAAALDVAFTDGRGKLVFHSYGDNNTIETSLAGGGTFSYALSPGDYFVRINRQIGGEFLLSGPGSASGGYTTTADFAITDAAVPEPAAWALLIAGFGLAGGALRRRPSAA